MTVLTIGNFDGVHRGHLHLLGVAAQAARRVAADVVVLTFVPHPRMVLGPEKAPPLLTTYEERLGRLKGYFSGLGQAAKIHEEAFGREFSSQSADDFLAWVRAKFSPDEIVVGHDFQFGRGRGGRIATLRAWAESLRIGVTQVPALELRGGVVSSSRIRGLLEQADLAGANSLLGYSFCYRGVVVHGQGRGRTLGIPTANVQIESKMLLPTGVYAVRLDRRPGIANFGVRPTFGADGALGLECHLFDFQGDLYGRRVEVEMIQKIRDERKFGSVDELKSAIVRDLAIARQVHASPRSP